MQMTLLGQLQYARPCIAARTISFTRSPTPPTQSIPRGCLYRAAGHVPHDLVPPPPPPVHVLTFFDLFAHFFLLSRCRFCCCHHQTPAFVCGRRVTVRTASSQGLAGCSSSSRHHPDALQLTLSAVPPKRVDRRVRIHTIHVSVCRRIAQSSRRAGTSTFMRVAGRVTRGSKRTRYESSSCFIEFSVRERESANSSSAFWSVVSNSSSMSSTSSWRYLSFSYSSSGVT
jgi:hypothetical protein